MIPVQERNNTQMISYEDIFLEQKKNRRSIEYLAQETVQI